jgi:hypothetical protein
LIACCFLAGGLAAAAPKDKEVRPVVAAPPPAMPQSLTVARGKTLEIQLRIYGGRNEALSYVIKRAPGRGKLSPPRPLNRSISVVTYEPPDDLAITSERFTYSVQSLDGVSAPVEVSIAITDEPAKLTVPEALDFPELLAGDTAEREFELANRGGGVALGEVKIDPPWKIDGDPKYRLAAGEYRFFKVIFAPAEGGTFRGEMRFTSVRELATSLRGVAVAPVSVEPPKVELRHEPDDPARRGGFEIVNRTQEERRFELNGGERLRVQKEFVVPANGRVWVSVSTDAADVAALSGEVRVEAPGFALRVPIQAPKVGPIIRVDPTKLSFGRIDASAAAQVPFAVENTGGSIARVSASIGEPFVLPQPNFDLAPGEKKQLALAIQPAEPNRYRAWLLLKVETMKVELEVEAEMLQSNSTSAAAASRPMKGAPHRTKSENISRSEETPVWMPDLNVVKDIQVSELTPTTAKLAWPAHLSAATTFQLERLMLMRDSAGEIRNVWVPMSKVAFAREGASWSARIQGLVERQSQTIRVVPIAAGGERARSLFRVDFDTPAKPQILPRLSLLQICLLALAVCVGVVLWRKFRSQAGQSGNTHNAM